MNDTEKSAARPSSRPPIVAVLGHVDHGKTTLLDAIRKTDIAGREHGGITQKIGAYQVKIPNPTSQIPSPKKAQSPKLQVSKQERAITFIDTPGHEAFAKMRSRGASAADIAILVVAADDSVKPQTKESIDEIQKAGIPMIVALSKIDVPAANADKVKSDLARAGVQVAGFGGDVPIVPVSAKNGTGIDTLLSAIGDVAATCRLPDDREAGCEAVVIETKVDKGKGPTVSVIVKHGRLTRADTLYEGATEVGKVRAMFDEYGTALSDVPPGKPAEVLGFRTLPAVGSLIRTKAETPKAGERHHPAAASPAPPAMPDFLKPVDEQERQKLNIILKADTAGSIEAIELSLDERVRVVRSGIGEITEADILEGKANKAVVVGFSVPVRPAAGKLAETERVVYRSYRLIYELLEELAEVVAGLKEVTRKERELGKGQIIAEFPFDKDRIAGTKVLSGRLARGDTVKIMRQDAEVGRAKIKSLKQGKNDVTKVEIPAECGILFDRKVDFMLQDAIIAVTL
ncbi:translation initiation factor IF-2 [Patescibacteria group bacterium]|nr:translation initiation factor IF-2 [Patescibacteria group bacterium]